MKQQNQEPRTPGSFIPDELANTNANLKDTVNRLLAIYYGLQLEENKAQQKQDYTTAKKCADQRILINETLGKIRYDGVKPRG